MACAAGPDDAARLCFSCGMCCNSTLFYHGGLTDDEREPAARYGLDIEEIDGKANFRQPCRQFDGTACAIFAQWRPRVCHDFRCTLLARFDNGEIPLDEAVEVVAHARALLNRLPADMRTLRAMRDNASQAQASMAEGPLDPDAARQMMDAVIALRFLDEHFRKDGKKVLAP